MPDPMATEPTNVIENAAALQEPGPARAQRQSAEVMLTDEDLESPSKKRKVCCKSVCTLMCMFSIVPNMYRVSHSAYVPERVFPTYCKTGDGPFRKKMESLPVAPVTGISKGECSVNQAGFKQTAALSAAGTAARMLALAARQSEGPL